MYNWSIDSILRFYSKSGDKEAVKQQLKLKNALNDEKIIKNPDLIIMLKVIYGGYYNIKSFELIAELFELVSFLNLSENQRMPFLFYYEEKFGRDDTAYQMLCVQI